MISRERILLIDDRIGDIGWLVDDLESRGYSVEQITNEREAREKLDGVRKALDEGANLYRLAIVDIMVPIMDIMELVEIADDFYEDSSTTGIRLCRYIRQELRISEEELPVVCLSSRSDETEIRRELDQVGIKNVFSRIPQSDKESIRFYLEQNLPRIGFV